MVTALAVACSVAVAGAALVFVFGGPSLRLRLARLTGSATFQLRSVHPAPGGVVIGERVTLRQGGEIGRVSFVRDAGEISQRLFDRERGVLGITGALAWTDAPGRVALRLPDLSDGPAQRGVVEACGLTASEVTIHRGALRVVATDGRTWLCDPDGGEPRPATESPRRADPPQAVELRPDGRRHSVVGEGRTLREGLLEARFARAPEGGAPMPDAVIVHRASLTDSAPTILSRFASTGERWSRELTASDCRLVSVTRVVAGPERLLVVGSDASGRTCVGAVEAESGVLAWMRPLAG